jgi:hypothetical protein
MNPVTEPIASNLLGVAGEERKIVLVPQISQGNWMDRRRKER